MPVPINDRGTVKLLLPDQLHEIVIHFRTPVVIGLILQFRLDIFQSLCVIRDHAIDVANADNNENVENRNDFDTGHISFRLPGRGRDSAPAIQLLNI